MTFADIPTDSRGGSLADRLRIRFKPECGETFWMQHAEILTALDPASRASLAAWLAATDRIDDVLDLSPRAWHVPGDRTILGLFEKGKPQATFLIVAEQSIWTLAACDAGWVSGPHTTLADILALIDHRLAP
jgi:hypothetical protein